MGRVRASGVIALVGVAAFVGLLVAATAIASGSAHRHQRSHQPVLASASATTIPSPSPSIELTPTAVKLARNGAFNTSIGGHAFPAAMPVTIDTSTLDAACLPKFDGGMASPSTTAAGTDGEWKGSLAGLNCRPGVYAVTVQEQSLPYQSFVATVTLTL